MARDNEHNVYKEKWACFGCRKCFKQRSWIELLHSKRIKLGEERIVLCPQCREPMKNMGWDFKVPKQRDIEQWQKVELLIQHGYRFSSICCDESHQGPGPRPARLRDVALFLEQEAQKKKAKARQEEI